MRRWDEADDRDVVVCVARQLRMQARAKAGEPFAFLSPPLIASDAMAQVSGTNLVASQGFRAVATRHLADVKASLGEVIAGDGILTADRLAAMPKFTPPSASSPPWLALAWPLAIAAAATLAATRRYRRIQLN